MTVAEVTEEAAVQQVGPSSSKLVAHPEDGATTGVEFLLDWKPTICRSNLDSTNPDPQNMHDITTGKPGEWSFQDLAIQNP
jgi:hypothetical protein